MLRHLICLSAGVALLASSSVADISTAQAQEPKQIRWATSAVGSSGHRALVALATLLNREMPQYEITVLPTPGAAATVRGYSAGQFDGYYGADVAFHEIANREGRYKDFDPAAGKPLLQSFWSFTLEMGIGIAAEDAGELKGWRDLGGKTVFTGPAPWDTRATLERAMGVLQVGHEYVELDTGLTGSSLQENAIEAFSVYTTGESSPAPWVSEAMMTTEVAVLNPSEEEIADLSAAGIEVVRVDAKAFGSDIGVEEAVLVPLFYGFHLGLDVPEDDVFRMLTIIEGHTQELTAADAGFRQLAAGMVELQRRGIAASPESIAIHPGLARFLRERDAWDEVWDARVAG